MHHGLQELTGRLSIMEASVIVGRPSLNGEERRRLCQPARAARGRSIRLGCARQGSQGPPFSLYCAAHDGKFPCQVPWNGGCSTRPGRPGRRSSTFFEPLSLSLSRSQRGWSCTLHHPFHVSVYAGLTLSQSRCSILVEARGPPDRRICCCCIDAISSRLADNFSAVKASFRLLALLYTALCISPYPQLCTAHVVSARSCSLVQRRDTKTRDMTSWLAREDWHQHVFPWR